MIGSAANLNIAKMKSSIVFLFTLSLFFNGIAQTGRSDTLIQNAEMHQQAEKMAQLLLKKDFKSFTAFTYPKVVEMMGGSQRMVQTLEKGFKDMESQGIRILAISFGSHSPILVYGGEQQCILPQTIEMKVPGGRLVSNATLIAISKDNGKKWYFIDTSGKDIKTMKTSLKNLSGQLPIPEKQEPEFIRD